MSSQNGGNKSGEYQFNRFREVARKLGTERLAEELEESLARLVPPVPHRAANGLPNERQTAPGRSQENNRWRSKPHESGTVGESFDNVPTATAYMRVAPNYGTRADGAGTEISASDKQSPKPKHDQG